MIGLFAVAEILKVGADGIKAKESTVMSCKIKGFGITMKEFKEQFVNFIRSALLGIGIGILPGIGGARPILWRTVWQSSRANIRRNSVPVLLTV